MTGPQADGLLASVKAMRKAQRAYFAASHGDDKKMVHMAEATRLERQVDAAIKAIEVPAGLDFGD